MLAMLPLFGSQGQQALASYPALQNPPPVPMQMLPRPPGLMGMGMAMPPTMTLNGVPVGAGGMANMPSNGMPVAMPQVPMPANLPPGTFQGHQPLRPPMLPLPRPPLIAITPPQPTDWEVPAPQHQPLTQASNSFSQSPGMNENQRPQLAVPNPLNHSSLSPGLQGLSMGSNGTPNNPVSGSIYATGPSTPNLPPPSLNNTNILQPRPGIQRSRPPSPIKTSPGEAILAKLRALGTPVPQISRGIPILIFFPEVLYQHDKIGTDERGDAVMLGYMPLGSTSIDLTTAVFLPMNVYNVLLRRVQEGGYTVLETYMPTILPSKPFNPTSTSPYYNSKGNSKARAVKSEFKYPHQHAYDKLAQAFNLIATCDNEDARIRESHLTKRWRVTPDFGMDIDRGSLWEGWALSIDRGIVLSGEERRGAMVNPLVDGKTSIWGGGRGRGVSWSGIVGARGGVDVYEDVDEDEDDDAYEKRREAEMDDVLAAEEEPMHSEDEYVGSDGLVRRRRI